jgi:hypothetical protein
MGSFSIWHWLIILFVIGIPFSILGAIVWLIIRATRKSALPAARIASALTPEARLEELFQLRSKGLISLAEYEQQRAAVLDNI